MSDHLQIEHNNLNPNDNEQTLKAEKEAKRNQIKKILKDKLSISNINDLVLCDESYNNGLFGCIIDSDGKSSNSFGFQNGARQESQQPSLLNFGESSVHQIVNYNEGYAFLDDKAAIKNSSKYGIYNNMNYLGLSAIQNKNEMTEYQNALHDYFMKIRIENPDYFNDKSNIKFFDLFKFRGLLGQGSYGVVMIVQDKLQLLQKNKKKDQDLEEETYAIKIINKSVLHQDEVRVIRGESKILSSLEGKSNVVQFMNIFETAKYIIIQMEHLKGCQMKREIKNRLLKAKAKQGGAHNDDSQSENDVIDLQDSIQKKKKKESAQNYEQSDANKRPSEQLSIFSKFDDPHKFWRYQLSFEENQVVYFDKPLFNEEEASKIIKGVMNGLHNIHEMNYIHRDLKPDNIQLAPKGMSMDKDLKIIDFGLSAKQLNGMKQAHEDKIGTILYMAPEQISSKIYSKKIDIYAVGIIIYQMLVGYHPLYINGQMFGDTMTSLKLKVAAIEPDQWFYPSYVSSLAKDLICRLCRISQMDRYDAKRALQHPWITRKFKDQVPLTAKEERQRDEQAQSLKKCIRSILFVSLLKKHIIDQQQNQNNQIDGFIQKTDKKYLIEKQNQNKVFHSILNSGLKRFQTFTDSCMNQNNNLISNDYILKIKRFVTEDKEVQQIQKDSRQSQKKIDKNDNFLEQIMRQKGSRQQYVNQSMKNSIQQEKNSKEFMYKSPEKQYKLEEYKNHEQIYLTAKQNDKEFGTQNLKLMNQEANQYIINSLKKSNSKNNVSNKSQIHSTIQDILASSQPHKTTGKKQKTLKVNDCNTTPNKPSVNGLSSKNKSILNNESTIKKNYLFEYGEGMENLKNTNYKINQQSHQTSQYANLLSDEQQKIRSKNTLTNNWEFSHESKTGKQITATDQKSKNTPIPFNIESSIGNGLIGIHLSDISRLSNSNQKNAGIFQQNGVHIFPEHHKALRDNERINYDFSQKKASSKKENFNSEDYIQMNDQVHLRIQQQNREFQIKKVPNKDNLFQNLMNKEELKHQKDNLRQYKNRATPDKLNEDPEACMYLTKNKIGNQRLKSLAVANVQQQEQINSISRMSSRGIPIDSNNLNSYNLKLKNITNTEKKSEKQKKKNINIKQQILSLETS